MEASNENTTDPKATAARRCTILNFEHESPGVSLKSRKAIITLGGDDGTIDRIVLNAKDGVSLVHRLAFAFREDERPPAVEYGSRSWFSRNSILRAQSSVEGDVQRAYEKSRTKVPDVIEYMNEETNKLRTLLSRRGRNAPHVQTLVDRVRTTMLVLIEAMRQDT